MLLSFTLTSWVVTSTYLWKKKSLLSRMAVSQSLKKDPHSAHNLITITKRDGTECVQLAKCCLEQSKSVFDQLGTE